MRFSCDVPSFCFHFISCYMYVVLSQVNCSLSVIVLLINYLFSLSFICFNSAYRVATVREKIWKMKISSRQGKVREFHFQSGKFRQNGKSHGKVSIILYWFIFEHYAQVGEFQKNLKKLLVNRLLVTLFSINCKQF